MAVTRVTSAGSAGRAWPETNGASPRWQVVSSRTSPNAQRMIVTVPGTWRLLWSSGASWR